MGAERDHRDRKELIEGDVESRFWPWCSPIEFLEFLAVDSSPGPHAAVSAARASSTVPVFSRK